MSGESRNTGRGVCRWHAESVVFGSGGGSSSELLEPSQQENVRPLKGEQSIQPSSQGPSLNDANSVEQMLAGFMAVIQQSHNNLQNSIGADLSASNEKLEQFQNSVRADLNANQESVRAEINSIRNDIKVENGKLIRNFELKIQEIKKELAVKLDSEAQRLTNVVGQVQKEVESELLVVKGQMEEQGLK
jgi:outer membrane cobalamin receptor